jgi:hypothetical protein
MNDQSSAPASGLELLRKPFPAHQISKLPKQSSKMTAAKSEYRSCNVCGGWHHPKAVHLDYVGHAALTDRLLDCDPEWNWEPVAFTEAGAPALDENGGMWIKLTICGVTRYGYGHPDGKRGGDAIKEVIGDALRNAAMRFGAALDLWHKGDLHALEDDGSAAAAPPSQESKKNAKQDDAPRDPKAVADGIIAAIRKCDTIAAIEALFEEDTKASRAYDWLDAGGHEGAAKVIKARDERRAELAKQPQQDNADLGGDSIPY